MLSVAESEFTGKEGRKMVGGGEKEGGGGREGDQPQGEGDSYAVLHLGDYVLSLDNYDQVIDLSNYDELTDYMDQLPKVRGMQQTHCIPCKKLGA